MIRRVTTLGLAALLLGGPWAAPPAAAKAPTQAATLCDGAPRGCALETNDWLREGATFPVTVTGNANARVQVVVYRAVLADGALDHLRPISSTVDVITNSAGVAQTEVAIPALESVRDASGWALVSVGGVREGSDTLQTVGQFVPLGARVPRILGDGYGEEKPAGATLDLQFTGVIPGTRFVVEYRDEDGIWQEAADPGKASATSATAAAPSPDDVSTVSYTVPRGLAAKPHAFRLHNVSDSAVSSRWPVTLAADGTTKKPAAVFQPPPVGEDLSGANLVTTHPQQAVVLAAGGVAGGALLVTVLGVGVGLRRRGVAR